MGAPGLAHRAGIQGPAQARLTGRQCEPCRDPAGLKAEAVGRPLGQIVFALGADDLRSHLGFLCLVTLDRLESAFDAI